MAGTDLRSPGELRRRCRSSRIWRKNIASVKSNGSCSIWRSCRATKCWRSESGWKPATARHEPLNPGGPGSQAQEPALREQGASGLLDLAKEYVALLDDADAAATIYMELFQTRTGQQTARAELVKLGYQFDGTKWRKSDEAALETTPDAD